MAAVRGRRAALLSVTRGKLVSRTLATLRAEHRAIARLLHALEERVARARRRAELPDFALLRAMLFWMAEFPERQHHRKESCALFPRLRARAPLMRHALDRLEEEHLRGEARIHQLGHALTAFELLGEPRRAPFETMLAEYLDFQRQHMVLIYGLPKQTPESFARTIAQVAELRPDRIALYAYAHLPERFKPQRRIAAADLPAPVARVDMLAAAMAGFLDHDYDYVGMDHFALPGDPLAVAKREGRLQRNFQGYSTHPDCDLIGLGVSAIGRIGDSYYQNAKSLPEYVESLDARRLPVVRGLTLATDDLVRRDIIMALMCHGRVDFAAIERVHGLVMREAFADEIARLAPMVADGLVEIHEDSIRVTRSGWFVVRAVALQFDRYLQGGAGRERFSKIV